MLTSRIDKQANTLEDINAQIKQNTLLITSATKSIEFNSAEIQDNKVKTANLEKQVSLLLKDNEEMKTKTVELERYKRRWNLRINGMRENHSNEENARDETIRLLAKIAPHLSGKLEDVVDVAHRIGRKEEKKSRQMIVQFSMRRYRDEFWKITKTSTVCKEHGIRFAEDFTKEDREMRAALWPIIEKARNQGEKAFYKGPYGFINGRRITGLD
ncbi:hypothetical protein DPEC_G00087350 [Dallia pectoralis]|uniref:Uncharacterized protein n=1 Tax=Dallia pectoralis TaxID=75939 RepID=A0ACC2H002_DALPE|nr:hypothetical protein DPEC_G00087350 [Dallia pectoralis]